MRLLKPEAPYLERLVINVTHDCNMRCTYCFADTGAYGGERGALSETTGRRILEDFFSRFERIGRIQFFGGEPLLNAASIDALCRDAAALCEARGVPRPAFTVITNGTILTEPILAMIAEHQVRVTVSLDGPEALNDEDRVFAGGAGSFRRVVRNVQTLKARTGQPFQIEGTFTRRHLERDFSLAEFLRFLARDLGVHSLHMPWILGTAAYHGTGIAPTAENLDRLVRIYAEGISESFRSLTTPDPDETALISIVERFMNRAVGKEREPQRHYCPAGSGTLSVGMDGQIYPCFMFTNVKDFALTRVDAPDRAELGRNRATFVKRLERPAGEGGPREVMSSCAGMNYEAHGRITGISDAERSVWERVNAHLEREAAAWAQDSDTWEWMQTKFLLQRLDTLGVFDAPAACS